MIHVPLVAKETPLCVEMPSKWVKSWRVIAMLSRLEPALMASPAWNSLLDPCVAEALSQSEQGQEGALAQLVVDLPRLIDRKDVRAAVISAMDRRSREFFKVLKGRLARFNRAQVSLLRQDQYDLLTIADGLTRFVSRLYRGDDVGVVLHEELGTVENRIIDIYRREHGKDATIGLENRTGPYAAITKSLQRTRKESVVVPILLVQCNEHNNMNEWKQIEKPVVDISRIIPWPTTGIIENARRVMAVPIAGEIIAEHHACRARG
jgi:hypothetical protein